MTDVAILFAELERPPEVTQADLARRYQKSPGYVSVLCRLGHALRLLPPEARDRLRVPQLTFKAAQMLVSRYGDSGAVLRAAEALAAAPVGARRPRARHGVPGQWNAPPARPDPLDPLPRAADAIAHADVFTYRWDAALAQRDPVAALAAYEAYVRTTTDEVVARVRRAAGDVGFVAVGVPGAPGVRAGMSGAVAHSDLSLRRLHERVDATLRAHRERLQDFVAERDERRRRAGRPQPGGTLPPVAVDPAEVDADLA